MKTFPSTSEGIKYFVGNWGKDLCSALTGSGIYFAVAVAQACHESGFGTSPAAETKNNFKGIMSKGHIVTFATPSECFRAYVKAILNPNHDYIKNGALAATTPQDQLWAIANGGYCTDPPASAYYPLVNKMMGKVISLYDIGKL